MEFRIRFVGLDVHKDSIVVAVADSDGRAAEVLGTLPHDVSVLLRQLRKLGPAQSLRCCYEAGPTGYGLCRALREAGIACLVVAPSLVPVQSGNRVKTDRRDARKLAHFLRSGDLTEVWVPDEASEAIRDLERARDDAKRAERVARQQLGKFLLRHGRHYSQGTSWTQKHLAWIAQQRFQRAAQQQVLSDYLHTVEQAGERIERLDREIEKLVEDWALAPLVKALQALRGIRLLTAVTIAAEIGDLKRFEKARQLMAFVGAVPSENSTGERRRQGRITKTGNRYVRRVLVEAAWSYHFTPRNSRAIRARQKDVPQPIKDIAWRAQVRLHRRYRRMMEAKKTLPTTITAVARELAGFIWAVGQQVDAPPPHRGGFALGPARPRDLPLRPPAGVSQAKAAAPAHAQRRRLVKSPH